MPLPERYIGVSGVVSIEHQRQLAFRALRNSFKDGFVMAGIQATNKSVAGMDTKYTPQWHPKGEEALKSAAVKDDLVRPFIHLYDEHCSINVEKPDWNHLIELATRVDSVTREYNAGFQFNRLPFDLQGIEDLFSALREKNPRLAFVLQCHEVAMDHYGPGGLGEFLDIVSPHYALIDSSHGKGKLVNSDAASVFVSAMKDLSFTRTVIAGGLGPDTLETAMEPLLEINHSLGWDAEGQLRTISDTDGKSYLDPRKVERYLDASIELAKRFK